MFPKQLEFWDESGDIPTPSCGEKTTAIKDVSTCDIRRLLRNETEYVSIKKVSIVHDGSITARPRIGSTDDAKAFFERYWRECPGCDQERFVVACLDTKHHVQCVVVVTVGTLDASLVHPREVFKPAILEGSSAIILSHNHPSGDTSPSQEDRAVTDRLTQAGELLGITVLDHIIHGDSTSDVISLREI